MLNLVSTHQSLALHAKSSEAHEGGERDRNVTNVLTFNILDNPRCQNIPPYMQLMDGVRILDLRFNVWTGNREHRPSLFAWHGISNQVVGAAQGYSFGACLQTLRLFLGFFPTETVIISVTNETHADDTLFTECFHNDADGFEDILFHKSPGKESMHQITLDEVRGKVILLSVNLPLTDYILDRETFYNRNGAVYSNEDSWDKPPKEWPAKLQACRENMAKAKEDKDPAHTFNTCWNMSNAVSVPPYNPIDFYFAAKPVMGECLSEGSLGRGGQFRTGVVTFDFVEMCGEETLAVIRSNQGCEDVVR